MIFSYKFEINTEELQHEFKLLHLRNLFKLSNLIYYLYGHRFKNPYLVF